MRRTILLLTAALAPSLLAQDIRFGSREPLPKPAGAIRLATYNAENLFDDSDDPALTGASEDIDDRKPEEELAALAATIRRADPDILCMQEIESEAALRWFVDRHLKDAGYTHIASVDAGDERGIEQAVLSRHPIAAATNWPRADLGGTHPEKWGRDPNHEAGKPLRYHRSPLRTDIDISGPAGPYRLTLFVIHHKSGGPGGYWREAEARKTLELVRQASTPGANIALLGDLNSSPGAEAHKLYLAGGLIDTFADRDPKDPRFLTHESARVIDYIFVNGDLRNDLIPGQRFILGTPARPEGADWRSQGPPPGYASDHYLVAVDLTPTDS